MAGFYFIKTEKNNYNFMNKKSKFPAAGSSNMYSQKTLEYFQKPKHFGKIKNASGIGKVGNLACGDVMKLYIKVANSSKGEYIQDIKIETFGCVAAIATSGLTAELAKGKTIKEALKINAETIAQEIGGLPPIKIHCSLLAIDALASAIYDYLTKNKKPIPKLLLKKYKNIEKRNKILEERYKGLI